MEILHKFIGYVPQTIYLSDDTISANIAFGIENSQVDHKSRKVAKISQIYDHISSLPQAFNTVTGERGVRLSGSQRQQLASLGRYIMTKNNCSG